MLYIHGATLFTSATSGTMPSGLPPAASMTAVENSAVLIRGGQIESVAPVAYLPPPPEAEILEATGLILVPGFIDLQLNGGFGRDFTHEPAAIWEVAAKLPRYGVTAFLPTIITAPARQVQAAQAIMDAGPPAGFQGALPLGLHLEGPFLSREKKGAHNPAYLRPPSLAATADWSPDRGVRLVTLAPERPGAPAVITALAERAVVVSAGHSMADYAAAQAGIEAGIRYGTHLFNAMPALDHRQPGLVGALLDDERVTLGLIADGVHVAPALVRLLWRAGGGRLNLVTDAMAALGMADGRYLLGDQAVTVAGGQARLADGTLAGSVLSLDAALRNLIAFTGCSLADALPAVTSRPAALLGLGDRKGQIAPGFDADLVLLTAGLEPKVTVVGGRKWEVNSNQ